MLFFYDVIAGDDLKVIPYPKQNYSNMNLNFAIGITSSIALFVPVVVILAYRLFTNQSFLALAINYFIVAIHLLMRQGVIKSPESVYQSLGIVDNLLDAPLMLLFLTFFSTSVAMKKRITAAMFIFIGFEAIILAIFGFSVLTVKIILGPDIAVILGISFMFFLRNVRLAVINAKSMGKAVMISSIFVSYSIFCLVYIFYYLARNTRYHNDARLIFYLVSILSALLMAVGILIEKKRIKKLDELRHTRKELAAIYGETAALNKGSRFLTIKKNQ